MIAKEWRDARWKFLIATVPVVLLVLLLSPYGEFVEEARRIPGEDPVENALRDLNDLYYLGGFFVLLPLAAFLGVASISGEVSSGTVLLLLSRPMSRTRLLLTKYAVCAGTLLVAAVLGKSLIAASPPYAVILSGSSGSWRRCFRCWYCGWACSSCSGWRF